MGKHRVTAGATYGRNGSCAVTNGRRDKWALTIQPTNSLTEKKIMDV